MFSWGKIATLLIILCDLYGRCDPKLDHLKYIFNKSLTVYEDSTDIVSQTNPSFLMRLVWYTIIVLCMYFVTRGSSIPILLRLCCAWFDTLPPVVMYVLSSLWKLDEFVFLFFLFWICDLLVSGYPKSYARWPIQEDGHTILFL